MGQTIQLRLGDCIVLLQKMDPGTIGAFICDPPYFLGFMSKDFDKQDGAHQDPLVMQERHEEWLREAYRVLPPGGLIKAFSGTRTQHRLAAAMEAVGFELVPGESLEAWTYGCLSDDTEILTEHGWKPGLAVEVGERVACWDSTTGEIRLEAVQDVTRAPYEGEMVVFRNDNTDQLLTPNHRVYKKHRIRQMVEGVREARDESEWGVQRADEINRWDNLRLPLAGLHEGEGAGGEDWVRLLAWVWTEGGFDQTGTGVRIYQSSVNMEHVEEIRALLGRLVPTHKEYSRGRVYKDRFYTEYTWYFSLEPALRVRAALPEKRPTWGLLWAMSQAEKHAFVDAALKGDGACSRGRWAFYQKHPDDLVWFQTLAHLMNRQGRVNYHKWVVGLHMNPQTQLQNRHLKAAVSERYDGMVWCVRVPTGAFLARRNDKVFITGNSGFPKSLNISKAIDKMHGVEREIVGTKLGKGGENLNQLVRPGGGDASEAKGCGAYGVGARQVDLEVPVTVPATKEAELFEGFGTALKPAWEPVLVGRKEA